MTKNRYSRRKVTVSRWNRSQDRIACACARRNCAQLGPARRGEGSIPADCRIFQTVEAPIRRSGSRGRPARLGYGGTPRSGSLPETGLWLRWSSRPRVDAPAQVPVLLQAGRMTSSPSSSSWAPSGVCARRPGRSWRRRGRGEPQSHGPDLGQHGLGTGPVARVPTVPADRVVAVITQMLGHLRFQSGLEHCLVNPVNSPSGPTSSTPSARAACTSCWASCC
jgi:hypothetical protein